MGGQLDPAIVTERTLTPVARDESGRVDRSCGIRHSLSLLTRLDRCQKVRCGLASDNAVPKENAALEAAFKTFGEDERRRHSRHLVAAVPVNFQVPISRDAIGIGQIRDQVAGSANRVLTND